MRGSEKLHTTNYNDKVTLMRKTLYIFETKKSPKSKGQKEQSPGISLIFLLHLLLLPTCRGGLLANTFPGS